MFERFRWKAKQDVRIIETGLKSVDLLAPTPRGRDVLISGDRKSGARVVGNELACRLYNMPRLSKKKASKAGFRILIFIDSAMDELDACLAEIREAVPGLNEIFVTTSVSQQDIRQQRSEAPCQSDEVIFAFSTKERFVYEFSRAIKAERRDSPNSESLTTFVVTESVVSDAYDVRLISSRDVAAEGIYPALDVRTSFSNAFGLPRFSSHRTEVAAHVRRRVSEAVADLYPGATREPGWRFIQEAELRPAAQALRYMSQPYFVGEPYTGMKAAFVPLDQTLKTFEAILAGRFSDAPLADFFYKNQLDSPSGKKP